MGLSFLDDVAVLSPRGHRRLVNAFFVALAIATVPVLWLEVHFFGSWPIADWLINYQAGFVRRGLVGELAYLFGHATHLSPEAIVVVGLSVLYAALLWLGRRIVLQTPATLWCLLLTFCPLTFLFHIWDPNGGFRKETILLVLLLWMLTSRRIDPARPAFAAGLLVIALPTLVLTHEALLFFTPYLLAALMIRGFSLRQLAKLAAVPVLASGMAAVASAHFHGSLATAQGICASLGHPLSRIQGRHVCDWGAIGFLTYNSADGHAFVVYTTGLYNYWAWYGPGLLLTLAPMLAGSVLLYRRGERRTVSLFWLMAAAAWFSSLTLFWYSTDWGRWIFIHCFCMAVLLLAMAARQQTSPQPVRRLPAIAWIAVGAYVLLWSAPHVPGPLPPYGILGVVSYIREHLSGGRVI